MFLSRFDMVDPDQWFAQWWTRKETSVLREAHLITKAGHVWWNTNTRVSRLQTLFFCEKEIPSNTQYQHGTHFTPYILILLSIFF